MYLAILSAWVISLVAIASANPVIRKLTNTAALDARSPVTNDDFADSDEWPTNVLFVAGTQTYGMWIPEDGQWHDLSTITCLGTPAYALGACDDTTVDKIGVVAGDGPCSFTGNSGFTATLEGTADEGWTIVGPPQNILLAQCGGD